MDFLDPPQPQRIKHIRDIHGETFTDYYEWLRNKDSQDVQSYVAAQDAYADKRLEKVKPLASALFDELKSHVEENDMSVPVRLFGYWYFTRTQEGRQYGISCRVPVKSDSDWDPPRIEPGNNTPLDGEEIIFDANREAQGHDFFRTGGIDLSDDGRWMLYLVDTRGDERYDCYVRDLASGRQMPDTIRGISSNACFTPDGQWIFYTRVNDAWRPDSVWRHRMGTDTTEDREVFHEDDGRFNCGVGLSFDESLIVIECSSKTTSEVHFLDVGDPEGEFSTFIPRRDGVEYDVSFAKFEDAREILREQVQAARLSGAGKDSIRLAELAEGIRTDEEGNIPVAVVVHNVYDPNFQIDIINMLEKQPPYTLGDGTCIARGSDYGCEKAEAEHRRIPVDTPYSDAVNPGILQSARGLAIGGLGVYRHFVTLAYRSSGLPHIAVEIKGCALADYVLGRPWGFTELTGQDPHALYSVDSTGNPSYEAPTLRYSFTSYVHPAQLRAYDPAAGKDTLLKAASVKNYNEEEYAERRIWVRVRDGEKVPVSLTWKRGLVPAMDEACDRDGRPLGLGMTDYVLDAPGIEEAQKAAAGVWGAAAIAPTATAAPMFITAYGSYGISCDPGFGVPRLSFLDRGVLRAEVHTRGGGEMGRAWYEQGRRLNKINTFNDFIDVTAALQARGWASPETTVANGGSAGGLLMGAVANRAPFLYAGIEADVPFVDALNSILDPSLPLTVTEWDEWGDPLHDKNVYGYMRAYTPYENVASARERSELFGTPHFPRIFITTSMNDTRVLYVEPLKWLSRLQEAEVGADAFARIETEAGHGGVSGRYKAWKQVSLENAWCLAAMGIRK